MHSNILCLEENCHLREGSVRTSQECLQPRVCETRRHVNKYEWENGANGVSSLPQAGRPALHCELVHEPGKQTFQRPPLHSEMEVVPTPLHSEMLKAPAQELGGKVA